MILGDKRLSARLADIAKHKALSPGQSWLEIAQGDRASTKAYYRFVSSSKPEVTFDNILKGHRNQTIARMRGQKVVLAIQDTTELNFNTLNACEGLGVNGKNSSTGKGSKGLKLHSTFVVNEQGLPLGILRADCYARKSVVNRTNQERKDLPITEKETYRWVQGVADCVDVSKELEDTKVVCICDREGDIYEIYDYVRSNPEVEILIRATHHRQCKRRGYSSLFSQVKNSKKKKAFTLEVPAKSARSSKSNQKSSQSQDCRIAKMQLRYDATVLPPPNTTLHRAKSPVKMWMIHVVEEDAPEGVKPIEWFLATTIPINNKQVALECLKWYRYRWRIEQWHRVIKSGCNIEKVKNRTAENVKRAISIDLVVGWRIMLMCLLSRETPELPADVVFSKMELNIFNDYSLKKN